MKHKKTNQEIAQEAQQLPDDDPYSKKNIIMVPLGQDARKTRYWAVDCEKSSCFLLSVYRVCSRHNRVTLDAGR